MAIKQIYGPNQTAGVPVVGTGKSTPASDGTTPLAQLVALVDAGTGLPIAAGTGLPISFAQNTPVATTVTLAAAKSRNDLLLHRLPCHRH